MTVPMTTSNTLQVSLEQSNQVHHQESQKNSDLLQDETKDRFVRCRCVSVHFWYLDRVWWKGLENILFN